LVLSWTLNEVRSHFGSGQMWVRHKDGGRMITNYIFSLQRAQKVEKKVFKRSLKLDSTRSFTINNGSTCRPERMKWKDVHVFFFIFFSWVRKKESEEIKRKRSSLFAWTVKIFIVRKFQSFILKSLEHRRKKRLFFIREKLNVITWNRSLLKIRRKIEKVQKMILWVCTFTDVVLESIWRENNKSPTC